MYPSLLSRRTSIVAAALLIYKNSVKSCVFSSYCGVVCCNFCCLVYAFLVVVVVVFVALVVGFWLMPYVIFAALFVGFRVLLCNYKGSFLTCPLWSSGNFSLFWFLIKFLLFIKKKKKKTCLVVWICRGKCDDGFMVVVGFCPFEIKEEKYVFF